MKIIKTRCQKNILLMIMSICLMLFFNTILNAATTTSNGFTVVFRTNETLSSKQLTTDKMMYINKSKDKLSLDSVMGFRRVGDNTRQNFILKTPNKTTSFDPTSIELLVYETTSIPTTVGNLANVRTEGIYMSTADLAAYNIETKLYYELNNTGVYEEYVKGNVSNNSNITSLKVELKQTGDSTRYTDKNGVYLAVIGVADLVINEANLTDAQVNSAADISTGLTYSLSDLPYQTISNAIRYYNPVIEGNVIKKDVNADEIPTWDITKAVSGVNVYLKDETNQIIATAVTDASGYYKFSNRRNDNGISYQLNSAFSKLKVVIDNNDSNISVWNIDYNDVTSNVDQQEIGNLVKISQNQYDVSVIPVTNWNEDVNAISNDIALLAKNSNIGKFILAVQPKVLVTITYDGNGNTSGTAPVDSNNPYNVDDNVGVLGQGNLAKVGYNFIGWSLDKAETKAEFIENSSFQIKNNTTLYAVWKSDKELVKEKDKENIKAPKSGNNVIVVASILAIISALAIFNVKKYS